MVLAYSKDGKHYLDTIDLLSDTIKNETNKNPRLEWNVLKLKRQFCLRVVEYLKIYIDSILLLLL